MLKISLCRPSHGVQPLKIAENVEVVLVANRMKDCKASVSVPQYAEAVLLDTGCIPDNKHALGTKKRVEK